MQISAKSAFDAEKLRFPVFVFRAAENICFTYPKSTGIIGTIRKNTGGRLRGKEPAGKDATMNKQYALPMTAALGGAAAFVLRLLQNQTGFEPDTGLPIPGSLAAYALLALLAVLAVLLAAFTRFLPGEEDPVYPFPVENSGLLTLPVLGIFAIAFSGAADLADCFHLLPEDMIFSRHALYGILREGGLGFSAGGQAILGVLSLLSAGVLFWALLACRRENIQPPSNALLLPVLTLVIRVVLTYRIDSVNPSLQLYYMELLALVFLTLGFYRLSSYAFQAGDTRRFALYTGAAAVLSIASLADGSAYLSSLLLYAGGTLTLLGFLLVRLSVPEPEDPNPFIP